MHKFEDKLSFTIMSTVFRESRVNFFNLKKGLLHLLPPTQIGKNSPTNATKGTAPKHYQGCELLSVVA